MLEIILYVILSIVLLIIMIFIVIPAAVYMIVKVGTFAFFRGKQQFKEETDNEQKKS